MVQNVYIHTYTRFSCRRGNLEVLEKQYESYMKSLNIQHLQIQKSIHSEGSMLQNRAITT